MGLTPPLSLPVQAQSWTLLLSGKDSNLPTPTRSVGYCKRNPDPNPKFNPNLNPNYNPTLPCQNKARQFRFLYMSLLRRHANGLRIVCGSDISQLKAQKLHQFASRSLKWL